MTYQQIRSILTTNKYLLYYADIYNFNNFAVVNCKDTFTQNRRIQKALETKRPTLDYVVLHDNSFIIFSQNEVKNLHKTVATYNLKALSEIKKKELAMMKTIIRFNYLKDYVTYSECYPELFI